MTPDEFAATCRDASRDVRRLPAEVRRALGRRVRDEVAAPLATDIRGAGTTTYGRLVAPTAKVRASGDPTVVVGGARRVASGGAKGRDLVHGIHFPAGNRVTAVPARAGRAGYRRRTTRQFDRPKDPFVFRTIAARLDATFDRWASIVTDTVGEVIGRG